LAISRRTAPFRGNTDIAQAVCTELNVSCETVRTEWEQIIPDLLARQCDTIIASMAPTAARRDSVYFTADYYISPSTFVARTDSGLGPTPEDMRGRTVGVQLATAHQEIMERSYPDTMLKTYATPDEAYRDLVAGRLDAVLGGRVSILTGFLATPAGSGFALIGLAKTAEDIPGAAFAVRKEDVTLRDQLSAAIAALHASGKYQEFGATWPIWGRTAERSVWIVVLGSSQSIRSAGSVDGGPVHQCGERDKRGDDPQPHAPRSQPQQAVQYRGDLARPPSRSSGRRASHPRALRGRAPPRGQNEETAAADTRPVQLSASGWR
jgi:ABC-type amino acid transport substrate-binding protein